MAVPNPVLLSARGSPLCVCGKAPGSMGAWGGGGVAPAKRGWVGVARHLGLADCAAEVAELAAMP